MRHRAIRPWLALWSCAALLAGCADLEAMLNPEPATSPSPPSKPPAAPPPVAVAPPPSPPQAGTPRPGRKPAPPGPGVAPASRPPEESPPAERLGFDPETLRGMRPEEVARVLGDPWQRAEASPATVWRYVTRACELDLWFYLDLQSRVTRVLDINLRPADFGGERCVEQLVAERRAREGASTGASGPR